MKREEYLFTIKTHLSTSYNLTDDKLDTMIPRLLEMLSSHLIKLEELSRQDDLKALGHAGHALKGALLNLGLLDLAQKAFLIERKCKASDSQVNYIDIISKLKDEIELFT